MFRQTLRAGAAFMRARGSTASRTASRSMATTATRSSSRRVALGASVAGVAAGATWLSLDEAHCSILDYFFGGSSAPAMPKEWEPVAEDIVAIIEDNMRMGPTFVRLVCNITTICLYDGWHVLCAMLEYSFNIAIIDLMYRRGTCQAATTRPQTPVAATVVSCDSSLRVTTVPTLASTSPAMHWSQSRPSILVV